MKEYSYYPGCSAEGANRSYDISARNVAKALGVDLIELEDWNCCGATTYLSVEETRAMALSARNLALVEKDNRDMVTICNGCFRMLRKTNEAMASKGELSDQLTGALRAADLQYNGTVKVRHLLDVLVTDVGESEIRSRVRKDLKGLKVAPYYGCQLTRPKGSFDDPEFPTSLDSLFSWLGAEPVWYPLKTKCCGGMLMTTQSEVCERLVEKLLRSALQADAECLATICPLCQINLEGYQERIGRRFGTSVDLPILSFTQIMGLAFDIDEKDLLLSDNLTPSEAVVGRY